MSCKASCTANRCLSKNSSPSSRRSLRLTDDLAPLALEVAHENLIVQLIDLGRHAPHVGGKDKQAGHAFWRQEASLRRIDGNRRERLATGDDVAPLTKRWYLGMIGRRPETHAFQGCHHAPEGLAGIERRSRL